MKLFTPIDINPYQFKIEHTSKIVSLGSCFSSRIGERLYRRGFNISVDPMGTLFNPFSMGKNLSTLMSHNVSFDPDGIVKDNDLFHHLDFPHTFSHHNENILKEKLTSLFKHFKEFIQDSSHLLITFGTSKVYEYENHGVVASCHKIPQKYFKPRLLEVDEMVQQWSKIVETHSDKNFVFTVSPVRHVKDGMTNNQISKSKLILAVHQLCEKFDHCFYFPAYEIMMDELRDYRFYTEDLLHPSPQATEYIFEKFSTATMSKETIKIGEEFKKMVLLHEHRPLQENSIQELLIQQKKSISDLEKKYPDYKFKWIQDRRRKD